MGLQRAEQHHVGGEAGAGVLLCEELLAVDGCADGGEDGGGYLEAGWGKVRIYKWI